MLEEVQKNPPDPADWPDEQIVTEVVAGKVVLFGTLIRRYEYRMRAYGRRFLASQDDVDDEVQEVFFRAYQNLQDFDTDRRFSPWLYRIAHNVFVNALRQKKRRPLVLFDRDLLLPHAVAPSPEEDIDREELRRMLEVEVDKLDPKYREPLILYYFDELSYQDIAEVLHIPPSTVGIRITRGRGILRKLVNSHKTT